MLAQISTRIYCRGHVLLLALLFVSMNSVWAALPAEISGPFYLSSWNYRPLAPTGQAICILTKVAGKFDHSSDRISVEVSGDRWQLSAVDRPDDNQTYGTAYCFDHSFFRGLPPWEKWFSNTVTVASNDSYNCTSTWLGDATTILNGISGKWRGGGERASVDQSVSGWVQSLACVNSGQSPARGHFLSYFVGNPHSGWEALYENENSGRATVANGGKTFVARSGNCLETRTCTDVKMARIDRAMCHFTYISGKFEGGAERVEIYPHSDGHWHMISTSAQGYIEARARCFAKWQCTGLNCNGAK